MPEKSAAQAAKKKRGRPRLEIDASKVMEMAELGCTVTEIAAVLGCSDDTLHRNFAAEIAKGHETRNSRLRTAQIRLALKGNAIMLIWLGKQYLGQADKQELKQTSDPLTSILDELTKRHDLIPDADEDD